MKSSVKTYSLDVSMPLDRHEQAVYKSRDGDKDLRIY